MTGLRLPPTRTYRQRELAVLSLLSVGHTYLEAGRLLYVSERTVKNDMSAFMWRHNLRNATHAVAYATSQGWIRYGVLAQAKDPAT